MTRALKIVALTGILGAVALLSMGKALSGRPAWLEVANVLDRQSGSCADSPPLGDQLVLPFKPTDHLTIDLPASIHYQPGGEAQAIVTGDPAILGHVKFEGDRLTMECNSNSGSSSFQVTISGPPISNWKLMGSGEMSLSEIDQPKLDVTINGSGSVNATGKVEKLALTIAGSGSAQTNGLEAKSAAVKINGSGDAEIKASVDAEVSLNGSGNVRLSGHPTLRKSEINGSGRIKQDD